MKRGIKLMIGLIVYLQTAKWNKQEQLSIKREAHLPDHFHPSLKHRKDK